MYGMKKLCLVVLASLAVMAATGVASASASEFKAESFPVTIKGSGTQEFGTSAGNFTCSSTVQTGEGSSSATWWSVKVSDSGCKFGGSAGTIETGECEILYYTYSGYYVVCKGGAMKLKAESGCIVEIGPQKLETVSYKAGGAGTTRTITAKVSVTGMSYTQSSKCAGGAGTFTNGTIGGEVLLKGFTTKGVQQGIFIE
jgi:hypothetical protein